MLGKLYGLLAVLSIATLLAGGGVTGYLAASGQLTPERMQLVGEVVRGEHDDLLVPEEDAPTTQPALEPGAAIDARKLELLRDSLGIRQLADARLERILSDITARQSLLDQSVQDLIVRGEHLDDEKTRWGDERAKLRSADLDEGFKSELETIEKLSPKQAKEHLVRTWDENPADAVRIVHALPVSKRQRILDQLKTPEELDVLHELLERLRLMELDDTAPTSGTTTGDTTN
ncbi:MAG: hypothetical protein JXO22_04330 [Phycisphaerae bacterium]|nr:hypothetical protein [Phycisphaerae bacterium]